MANKKQVLAGVAGLMAQPAQLERPRQPEPGQRKRTEKAKGNYKTVCYSIPPDLAERMRAQAQAEGRTIGGTVSRAFLEYLEKYEG